MNYNRIILYATQLACINDKLWWIPLPNLVPNPDPLRYNPNLTLTLLIAYPYPTPTLLTAYPNPTSTHWG